MPSLAEIAFGPNVSAAIIRGTQGRAGINQLRDQEAARGRAEQFRNLLSGGIPGDTAGRQELVQGAFRIGPEAGFQLLNAVTAMNEQERQQNLQEGRTVATFLAGVRDQSSYDRARAGLERRGVDISSLPEQFSPEEVSFRVNAARDLENILASQQPGEGFTLEPGETRFGPGGNVIASVPADTSTGGFTLTPGQTRFNQLGEQIASLPASGGDDPTVANQLRDEFVAQTNEFVDVQNAFRKVEAAARSDSGPGDIALLVGYMKIIDPGSVVREGEFATAETAGGVSENVRNLYNRVVSGERLTPDLRQRFVQAARDQFETYTSGYNQTVETYTGLAQRFGLDPANVVINRALSDTTAAGTETVTPTAGAATQPLGDISSMTREQLDALDPATMTPAELAAAEQRLQELSNAR